MHVFNGVFHIRCRLAIQQFMEGVSVIHQTLCKSGRVIKNIKSDFMAVLRVLLNFSYPFLKNRADITAIFAIKTVLASDYGYMKFFPTTQLFQNMLIMSVMIPLATINE